MPDFKIGIRADFAFAETVKRLGADYLEVGFANVAGYTDEEVDERLRLREKLGLPYEIANSMLPPQHPLTCDGADFDAADRFVERGLYNCRRLGVKAVILGSSKARNYPEGVTYQTAYGRLSAYLKDHLAPLCEKYEIPCGLENLSYKESNILNTIGEEYNIVREVNSPWIKILVDFYHFGNNNDNYDDIRRAKDDIIHVHFASVKNGRRYPAPGDGDDNYAKWFDLLREIGYDKRFGRISIEAHDIDNKGFEPCVKGALEVMKQYNK